MVEGIIGKKIGMTQVFDEEGNVIPVTVIKAGPCTVIQKKTKEKDGYEALQLGLVEEKPKKHPNKPETGHFKKSGSPVLKILREVKYQGPIEIKEGDQILVDIFEPGEKVHITGISKGKGFQGVVRRHGFAGGDAAHGSMFHRAPGSIGASSFPSRVIKGMRMGGRMGGDTVTIRHLKIVQIDKENNLLLVKGAIPGANGGVVFIRKGSFKAKIS
ncbi:MAG: 50S ribosomal protein L3 [Candidatus Saccharicenans sp.]|nr:MAG: 50S ribosomal protein L3 [Candidatus Aminicenantes bacterium]HEK86441.1 50S ribosomal protein L3 [Candidatus Aminicenantes bacterium]